MQLDRRIDVRISVGVLVYLVSASRERPAEQAVTENVSAGGVCVICGQRLKPGERQAVSPLSLNLQLPGRVVYCRPLSNKRFCVGLAFERCFANWWESQTELTSAERESRDRE